MNITWQADNDGPITLLKSTDYLLSDSIHSGHSAALRARDETDKLCDSLEILANTVQRAREAGHTRLADRFLCDTARVLILTWVERVAGHAPCLGYRTQLALAWRMFRRTRRKLEKACVIGPWPPQAPAA